MVTVGDVAFEYDDSAFDECLVPGRGLGAERFDRQVGVDGFGALMPR